jgi:hypothetical protein
MAKRKIEDEAEARRCFLAMEAGRRGHPKVGRRARDRRPIAACLARELCTVE